jgi:hypothetical protein
MWMVMMVMVMQTRVKQSKSRRRLLEARCLNPGLHQEVVCQ